MAMILKTTKQFKKFLEILTNRINDTFDEFKNNVISTGDVKNVNTKRNIHGKKSVSKNE